METFETKVMKRVHRIHMLRRVFNATACKAYGLVLALVGLFSTVSVVHVYANMPSLLAPTAFGNFLLGAVTNTNVVVQLMLVGLVVSVVMLVRDMARGASKQSVGPFAQA